MSTQTTLERWVRRHGDTLLEDGGLRNRRNRVVSLFDAHGVSISQWAAHGFRCVAYERLQTHSEAQCSVCMDGVETHRVKLDTADDIKRCLGDGGDLAFVVAVPPCTDLCSAGARWWKKKRRTDPRFQRRASDFLKTLYKILEAIEVPFIVLVPSSPQIRRCFRRPSLSFSPNEFGGYLDYGKPHPLFEFIPTQDAYKKRTLCYHGHGALIPWKKPVEPRFHTVLLKSGRTKRLSPVLASRRKTGARSVPPLGFCTAVANENARLSPTR